MAQSRRRRAIVFALLFVFAALLAAVLVVFGPYLAPRERHHGEVRALAFSADGERLLSGGEDALKLWAIGPRERRFGLARSVRSIPATPPGTWQGFWAAAFSPDAKEAASVTGLGRVEVWDLETGSRLRVFADRNKETMPAVAFSPDGALVAASVLEDLKVYEVGGAEVFHRGNVRGPLAFVGSRSLTGVEVVRAPSQTDQRFARLELDGGSQRDYFESMAEIEAVSTTPLRVVMHEWFSVWVRDEHGARLPKFTMDYTTGHFAISRDGSVAALAQCFNQWSGMPIPPVRHFDGITVAGLDTGRTRRIPEFPRDDVSCLALSPDGRSLAVGTEAGSVFLFDTATLRDP